MISGMTPVHSLELILLALMIAVAGISGVARKLGVSYPIVLVLVGLLSSLLPGIPRLPLPPDIVFLVFLPPLLYAAAWQTSWREFRFNIISVSMLAVGLVFFTAVGVAMTAHFFLPGFDWRLGFLLGAVVSPTDAVAASSIAKKVRMPQRIVDVLEGESLLNDATGLLALEFGVAMIAHGITPSPVAGALRFLWLLAGGGGLGLLVGLFVAWLERWIDDGPVEIAISLIVPYVCYLSAEALKASGVIAVVVCGLLMSRQSAKFFSPSSRLQASAVWDALEFLLNGFIFILLGLQLPNVLSGLHEFGRLRLLGYGTIFSLTLIALRFVWMYPGARFAYHLRRVLQHQQQPRPNPRAVFVLGWTGMRGVVALAAASSLPYTIRDGEPFPQRNLIVFLTFSVILVTLVVQGLLLPSLVGLMGFKQDIAEACEEGEARRIVLRAAIEDLEKGKEAHPEHSHSFDDLLHEHHHRLEEITECGPASAEAHGGGVLPQILRGNLRIKRDALNQLRDEGRIGDTLHRSLERELDLTESRLAPM